MTERRTSIQTVHCNTDCSFICSSSLGWTVALFTFAVNLLLTQTQNTIFYINKLQCGSNMTGADLCVNKPQSVPVIYEPPCTFTTHRIIFRDKLFPVTTA
jgi:hypothetical protein